jgi:DNA-binding NarL/FixJ family response regulator
MGGNPLERIGTFVESADPVLQAGLMSLLRECPEVEVLGDLDAARVAVVVVDDVDDDALRLAKTIRLSGCPRVVLVVARLDQVGLLAGAEAGACGFVRRSEALPARLGSVVKSVAAGDGAVPADLVGGLLSIVGQVPIKAAGPSLAMFCDREVEVLKLIAEGLETSEIARRLSYSERTVKGVIHEITSRLQLKNRSQAVAYAVRQGVI